MAKITNPTIGNDTKEKQKHLFKITHKDTRVTSMYATITHVDAVLVSLLLLSNMKKHLYEKLEL